jgi:acylglycerol lipase
MQHDAGTLTTDDGLVLATRRWLPQGRPEAFVLIVHGLSEHSGRYAHVATHLMLHDFAVLSYDHRHHGRSEGAPRAYIERFDRLVDDLDMVLDWARTEAGDRPIFLFGHSIGGAVVARYVIEHGDEGLAGVILSSAALKFSDDQFPLLRKIAPLLSRFFPTLPTTKDDRAYLSRDPSVQRAFMRDPLTYKGGLRTRTGWVALTNTGDIMDHGQAFTAPLYLFHGTADRITDPLGSQQLFEAAGAADKTLRLYDGFYHETLNEEERQQVLDELVEWLSARVQDPKKGAVSDAKSSTPSS